MIPVDLKSLIAKMNDTCRQSLEGAVSLTLSRSHYNVEIEHWLTKLLEESNGDIPLILRHYGADASRVAADLTRTLDGFKTGSSQATGAVPAHRRARARGLGVRLAEPGRPAGALRDICFAHC